jgi:hypothetical protein
MMKICYTVILGNYDQLQNPTVITPGWRYVCFTDTPEICKGTVYMAIDLSFNDWYMVNKKKPKTIIEVAKAIKWMINPRQLQKRVYHDGNFQVIGNLDEYIKPFEDAAFATRFHPSRKGLMQETQACLDQGKITPEEAIFVVDQLIDMDTDPQGLWENGLLYFNTTANFAEWDGHFWHLIQMLQHITRDQILLPMVLENEVVPELIDRDHAEKFFKYYQTHLK